MLRKKPQLMRRDKRHGGPIKVPRIMQHLEPRLIVMPTQSGVLPHAATRPTVSDVQVDAHGRHFIVRFGPGQALPDHRNPARIVLTALTGEGEITIAGHGLRSLPTGVVIQLDPGVAHSVVAGDRGLELRVDFIANCCERC
jgi:quercetin dioxygenase-like cupin family protein